VVESLNHDLPFNEFIRRQLAGDLIAHEHSVATGFLALGPSYISDGGDPESVAMARAETLDDRVDTVARGLLGVTVSCARCHDHKFDPIPQLDYYSLAGVFRNTRPRDVPLAPPDVVKQYDDHERQMRELNANIKKIKKTATNAERQLSEKEQDEVAKLTTELKQLEKQPPAKYSVVHALADADDSDMPLAVRGNPLKPGQRAPRRFLRIVAGEDPPPFTRGSGRLELASAITSRDNPLTARVFVNRVWQWHFGQALVRTPSNFGKLGEKPTHPELLDWLASKFTSDSEGGLNGSLKRLHRLVLTSATYQMQSDLNPQSFAADGDNRLLWRMNPRRLDVEAWRDALLSATGELDLSVGGSSVSDISKSSRRTLYASISRSGEEFKSDVFLRLFDFPQSRSTSEGRASSIVPQQSLFMLNSPFMAARARALTTRLNREEKSDEARIKLAYRLLYGRPANADELQLGLQFLVTPAQADGEQLSAWQQYAQVLLSANETMYLE
ncbi:MAG TPA: DUF1553 domain-containing protein, partial [Pirellulales bacterium]|nr:DUF1553 domain-containing protein [Pirellulales bacterium]